jgi:hypothetical protein
MMPDWTQLEEALEIWKQYKRLRPVKLFANALEAEAEFYRLETIAAEVTMFPWSGRLDVEQALLFVQRVHRWRDHMTIDLLTHGTK